MLRRIARQLSSEASTSGCDGAGEAARGADRRHLRRLWVRLREQLQPRLQARLRSCARVGKGEGLVARLDQARRADFERCRERTDGLKRDAEAAALDLADEGSSEPSSLGQLDLRHSLLPPELPQVAGEPAAQCISDLALWRSALHRK